MNALIECVTNFSEGRNLTTLQAIATAITSVPSVKLLHQDRGEAANRTVFTFIGTPEAVAEAAFQAARVAQQCIDMRTQQGEHPRLGATDVMPLIPLRNYSMEQCVLLAQKLGQRIALELGIPIYFYAQNASTPERAKLEFCRKGEYEGLKARLESSTLLPDLGPLQWNESVAQSGATILGARDFLIAVNFNLNTSDVKLAQQIAQCVRSSGYYDPTTKARIPGSLKAVKAIGWYIEEFGFAQVSINIVDRKASPLHLVYEEVAQQASKLGIQVTGTEIIGLIPEDVIEAASDYYEQKEGKKSVDPFTLVEDKLNLNQLGSWQREQKILHI